MFIKSFDTNFWYSFNISKGEWVNKTTDKLEDIISFEMWSEQSCPEDCKVPDETGFTMSIEDAYVLKAFLEVTLNELKNK